MAMNATVVIRAALRDGVTCLRESYFTPPFKVANITEDKKDPLLHLMLMCSSPGILDEDVYTIRVELEEGCRLQLHTQSYQRLFQMEKGASQQMEVLVGPGSSFCYLPHPCVPHANAIFTGRNKIFLSDGARLVWGEVLTCGRKLSGEIFRFSKYQSITEVIQNGKLVLRENINLQPSVMDMNALGQLEGYTHQASLLFMGGDGEGARGELLRKEVLDYLAGQVGMLSAMSTGPGASLVIRMLGNQAEPLHDCLKGIAGILSFAKPLAYAG
jgi:urease accessory protein